MLVESRVTAERPPEPKRALTARHADPLYPCACHADAPTEPTTLT